MTFMEEEAITQPQCWELAAALSASVAAALPQRGERVAALGCGSSLYMAQAYAVLREGAGAGQTDAFAASEFPAARKYDRVVAISRTGTTTELTDAVLALSGTRRVAITTAPGTPLTRAVDDVVLIDFADEQSVVQTRSATSALTLLRAHLGYEVATSVADARRALEWQVPAELVDAQEFTFLGRGWTCGIANEAALKLREAVGAWTEAYPAMEYRHGPISITEPGRVTWMFGELPAGLAGDIAVTGGTLVNDAFDPLADLIRVHKLAVAIAARKGLDPDRPRNLTRSVILEPTPHG